MSMLILQAGWPQMLGRVGGWRETLLQRLRGPMLRAGGECWSNRCDVEQKDRRKEICREERITQSVSDRQRERGGGERERGRE